MHRTNAIFSSDPCGPSINEPPTRHVPDVEIRDLRYVLTLAETRNFSVAAQRLHLSQSALSHRIRALELSLDCALFTRTTRRVAPTEAGETLVLLARRVLGEMDIALQSIVEMSAGLRGTLRLAVVHTFGVSQMPRLIAAFHARHPDVRVICRELPARQIEEQVLAGQADLGVGYAPAQLPGLVVDALAAEDFVVAVGRNHAVAASLPLDVGALCTLRWALLTPEFASRALVDRRFEALGVVPDVRIEMNSVEALIGIVLHGGLAAVLPRVAVEAQHGLRALAVFEPPLERRPALLVRAGDGGSRAARAMADLVRQAFSVPQRG